MTIDIRRLIEAANAVSDKNEEGTATDLGPAPTGHVKDDIEDKGEQ